MSKKEWFAIGEKQGWTKKAWFGYDEMARLLEEKAKDYEVKKLDTADAVSEVCQGSGLCPANKNIAKQYLERGPFWGIFKDGKLIYLVNYPEAAKRYGQPIGQNDIEIINTLLSKKTGEYIDIPGKKNTDTHKPGTKVNIVDPDAKPKGTTTTAPTPITYTD